MNIKKYGIMRIETDLLHRLLAIRGRDDLETFLFQDVAQDLPDFFFIIDDQDAGDMLSHLVFPFLVMMNSHEFSNTHFLSFRA